MLNVYTNYNNNNIFVNLSNVLQSPIISQEFLVKAKKALKMAGLIRPEQYELKIFESNGVVKIEVVFPEQGNDKRR